jgi:hypothetical protein
MPAYLFQGSLRLDYETALRADFERQNCSICPRYWYVDATFSCDRCGGEFEFKATEQRAWYEEYGFWIDSLPKHCLACRRDVRELKAMRQEYDRFVGEALSTANIELKKRLAGVIDRLYELGGQLPSRINENRRRLALQIANADHGWQRGR